MVLINAIQAEGQQKKPEQKFQELLQEIGANYLAAELSNMPKKLRAKVEEWRSLLLSYAGNDQKKYREMLVGTISGSFQSYSVQQKHAAGFFLGAETAKSAKKELGEEEYTKLFSGALGRAAREGYLYAMSQYQPEGQKKSLSEFFLTNKTGNISNIGIVEPSRLKAPPADIPQPAIGVQSQFPGIIAPSILVRRGDVLKDGISYAYSQIGARVDPYTGEVSNLPARLSGSDLIKFRSAIQQRVATWSSSTYVDEDNSTKKVSDWIISNLKNTADYDKFISALENALFATALSYLQDGSPMKNAFGDLSKSANYTTRLSKSDLAALVRNSFSAGGAVNFRLDDEGAGTLQVYLQRDGMLLVTNEMLATLTFGANLIAEVEPINGWYLEARAGAGGRTQSISGDQGTSPASTEWFLHLAGETEVPLLRFLSATVGASANWLVASGSSPYRTIDATAALKAQISPRFDVTVRMTKTFAEDRLPDLKSTEFGVEAGWSISSHLHASVGAGLGRMGPNIEGGLPVNVNVKIGFNF